MIGIVLMAAAVNIDVGRQLFVDDYLVERTDLRRVWHRPVKYEGNPVLVPETPWEVNAGGNAAAVPKGGGIWWDEREKVFKLWYEGGWLHTVCYATSQDGIHFSRPALDVCPGTNIVLPTNSPCYRPDSWSVVRDPHTADPSQRYKLLLHRPWAEPHSAAEGVVCVSPDGIHWREVSKLPPSGDRSSLFYDPFREKWVFSIRSNWKNPGETSGRRNRMIWETDDFLDGPRWGWNGRDYVSDGLAPAPERWLQADERDAVDPSVADAPAFPKTQLYCFDAVAYESVMLGLFEIHLGPENDVCERRGLPKITDVKFGFSRDGRSFHRGDYGAAIASSRWGSEKWDAGYVQPVANGCVVNGDELWFYYGAFRGAPERASAVGRTFDWRVDNGMYANGATGIAKLRRDGFASLEGTGEVLTKPLHFSGECLFVNVDARQGAIAAELIGPDGGAVEGFALADSRIERVDSTKLRLKWKTRGRIDVRKWEGHRLRFRVENAALYAFWIAQDDDGASRGYLAGGGPGYDGLRDMPKAKRPEVLPQIMPPDASHAHAARRHEGIPSVAVSPQGRLWATWYAGETPYEDEANYLVLSASDDGGRTWKEQLVCDPDGPDGPRRVFDPELWLAPDGRLRWTWTDKLGPCMAIPDGDQLWMAVLDAETGAMLEQPRVIAKGVMMCKPTVLRDGTWLFPVAQWWGRESAAVYASVDGGRTFERRGGATVPCGLRGFDEHSLVEKRDGTLKVYIRTFNGDGNCLWSAESGDGGRTWSRPRPDPLASCSSRAAVTHLASGAWLAVVHEGWRKWPSAREALTALISHDDGETWEGGLVVDARRGCSYPDVCQSSGGRIFVVSDFNRNTDREIALTEFSEEDVLSFKSPVRRVVSRSVK